MIPELMFLVFVACLLVHRSFCGGAVCFVCGLPLLRFFATVSLQELSSEWTQCSRRRRERRGAKEICRGDMPYIASGTRWTGGKVHEWVDERDGRWGGLGGQRQHGKSTAQLDITQHIAAHE